MDLPLLSIGVVARHGQQFRFIHRGQSNSGWGKAAVHFEPVINRNCRLAAPPPKRKIGIDGYLIVASHDMLGEQIHYFKPVESWKSIVCELITKQILQNFKCRLSQQIPTFRGNVPRCLRLMTAGTLRTYRKH